MESPSDQTSSSESDSSDSESDQELKALAVKSCQVFRKSIEQDEEDRTFNNSGSETTLFVIDKTPGSSLDLTLQPHASPVSENVPIKHVQRQTVKGQKSKVKKGYTALYTTKSNSKQEEKDEWALSSRLQVKTNTSDVYVNVDAYKQPVPPKNLGSALLEKSAGDELMKKSVITPGFEKQHTVAPYKTSVNQVKKQRRKERDQSKGKGWFHMAAPEMTEAARNDLSVLQMRRALDPKRFYKGPDIRALPKFFQMGRVVDSPLDFYSGRIPKKERKKTLVEELLADAEFRKFNKRKYAEIVEAKSQGRGAYRHMQRLKKRKR